jgi:thiol:disulfide interchange protein
MRGLGFGLMALMAAAFGAPAAAQDIGPGPHVRIALIAETDTPAPDGEVTLALVSTPDPGWHAYWQNPGDAGLPIKASWSLPYPVTAGPLEYPIPGRLTIAGLMNYVFDGPFVPLVKLRVGGEHGPGYKLPVKLHLQYLVCTDAVCVPEQADLATTLTIGDGKITPERRAQFDGWRAKLPRPLGSGGTYQATGGALRIAVPFPAGAAASQVYFYPATLGAVDYAAPQKVTRDGDRLVIETRGQAATGPIDGVLAVGKDQGFEVRLTAGQVAAAPASADIGVSAAAGAGPNQPPPAQGLWLTALIAFAGAVLGGVLLNIMPCVFPILSLKALSLAKANAGEGSPRAEALAYAAGVILVCLALGGTMLALRAAGASVGWAFQLQSPRVILFLLLLVTGIALNLAGLFELSAPGFVNRAGAKGTGGAFATGALAAFIATPCTGPFMGAALGATLVLPWPAALAVFGGLGLGIALPFLLLGFVPALRRRLPRPGAWMETLRHILSVPMFLTAIALAWVLGKEAGIDGMALGLIAALLAGLGLWWVGRRQLAGKRAWLVPLPLLLLALATIALIHPAPATAEARTIPGTEPFSEARLAALTSEGRPVFAYFTADWCLTCKVNEKGVIETDTVAKALADNKVAVLVGDWTNGDPALGRFIQQHNRDGVPLYLWYKPGKAEPEVLPQILTRAMLQDLAAAH